MNEYQEGDLVAVGSEFGIVTKVSIDEVEVFFFSFGDRRVNESQLRLIQRPERMVS